MIAIELQIQSIVYGRGIAARMEAGLDTWSASVG